MKKWITEIYGNNSLDESMSLESFAKLKKWDSDCSQKKELSTLLKLIGQDPRKRLQNLISVH